jgi:hypothetical protein
MRRISPIARFAENRLGEPGPAVEAFNRLGQNNLECLIRFQESNSAFEGDTTTANAC